MQVAQAPLYPVAYLGGLQQGGWKGGERAVTGLADSPEDFWKSPQNRSMMALTAAEIAAIALSAGTAAGAIAPAAGGGMTSAEIGALYAAQGMTAPAAGLSLGGGAAITGGALAAGASAYGISSIGGGSAGGAGEAPPDINEANDPATAAQFQRIRKAARMLGRAGTIKNKSAQTLGGGADGGQTLGTQLAVS